MPQQGSRLRLDELVVARGLAASRSAAKALIMAGQVLVAGQVCDKAGTLVGVDALVSLKARPRFVSRGGDKLDGALRVFPLEVAGRSALDIGSSTGGFVDCLLQRGVARVVALDVGRGQLDARLRSDPRVHVIEGFNARYATPDVLPWEPDLLTMDVSFISVKKVLPAVVKCMAPQFDGVVLVKPQFEAGPKDVGKGGIVRDQTVHARVLTSVSRFVLLDLGVSLRGICRSTVRGADGNLEFFIHIGRGGEDSPRGGEDGLRLDTLDEVIAEVVAGGVLGPGVDE